MNKQNELIKKSFTKLYDTALEITEAYNSKYIPLNALFDLIKASKMKKDNKLGDFPKVYNQTLDLLYKVSMDYCNANKLDKRLPMVVLNQFINQLKSGLDQ